MKTFFKSVIFTFALMGGCASGDVLESERWEFLQQKFIDEPEMAIGGWSYRNFKYAGPVLGAVPGVFGLWSCWAGLKELKKDFAAIDASKVVDVQSNKKKQRLCCVGLGVLGVCTVAIPVGVALGLRYWKKRVNFEAFRNYVLYWDEYKEYTPEAFHEPFDRIFKGYHEQNESEKYLKKVAWPFTDEIIKACVEHYKNKENQ